MRKGAIAALAILATGVAGFAGYALTPMEPAAAARPTAAATHGVPVVAGTATRADVPVLLNAIGSVQPYNMVTVKSRVDGQIIAEHFTEGQEITAGAPLIQIDPRAYQAALEQAQATKAKDAAELASAQTDLVRYSRLVGSGYQTQQSYDQQKAKVAQLLAAVKGDEAAIDAARLTLSYTDIRAPITGRLGARLVDVGNMVRASDGTALVTIAQLKPIYVSFTLAQENQHKLRVKQAQAPLEVKAIGDDNKTLLSVGKLTLIDNTIDQATGTIRLKASFANADERLWPGEFVNVEVVLSVRKGVTTVPAETVQEGPSGHYAYVIKKDDTVERRPVEVTATQNGIAVIAKGLSPGERVVVDGQYRLTNGARVTITQARPSAAS